MKPLNYFIKLIFLLLVVNANAQQASNKPNIIFILVDDLGYGDVGFNGQKRIKTPHIDQLASEGMIFTNSYTGSTVCGPSRVSLMTGKHTGHSTVRENPTWTATGKPIDISLSDVTVAEELKRVGYQTAIIGKWGLAENKADGLPLKQGFDEFYGFTDHKTPHHYYPESIWENDMEISIPGNWAMEKKGKFMQDELTVKALNFIEKEKETPFFLYLNYTLPHFELTVPEDSKKQYENLGWPKKMMKKEAKGYQHDEEGNVTYAAMISRLDDYVGKILSQLKSKGIDENTMVIFTSDNGPEYAIINQDFFESNGPFTGFKRDLNEGGIRTPFAIRWPAVIKLGSKTDKVIAFWDFLPTVCDLTGIKPSDKKIDGISYLPTILGNTKKQKEHAYLYWEFNEDKGPKQAIRKGNWKAIKFYQKPTQLYDISVDLEEKNNLAAQNPKIVKQMEKLFVNARTEDPNFPLVPKVKN